MKENENRERIFDYIRENPGAHLSLIKRELELASGTVFYHLGVLVKNDMIVYRHVGRRKCYSLPGPMDAGVRLTEAQIRVAEVVRRSPRIGTVELAENLNMTRQGVEYHLKNLLSCGVVRKEGKKFVWLPARMSTALEKSPKTAAENSSS